MNPVDRNLTHLLEMAQDMASKKNDHIGKVADIKFTDADQIIVTENFMGTKGSVMYPMTENAMSQAFVKLGVGLGLNTLPTQFMLALTPEWRAYNLNRAIETMPDKSGWMVRAYEDKARAIMDQYYFPFDNVNMLEILGNVLDEDKTPHRISRQSFVNPDAMRVDVLMGRKQTRPDGGGNAEWHWGVGLKNNEIGQGGGGAFAVIKRTSCDNSIAVDMEGYNYSFRHWAKKDELRNLKKTEFKVAIANILPFGVELIDKMLEADYQDLPSFADVIGGMSLLNNWDDEFVGNVWRGSEGRNTIGGIINGVTYAAQTLEDPQARFEMELLGGAILVEPDSIFSPALYALEQEQRSQAREQARNARAEAKAQTRRTNGRR